MVEFSIVLVALAFVVLVGYLIPTVIQIKKTITESERLLSRLNTDLPVMLKEMRGTSENVRSMTDQAKMGVDRASVFLKAVGDVGQTVQQVNGAVRGKGGAVLLGITSVMAGLKAVSNSVKQRVHKEGGKSDGK